MNATNVIFRSPRIETKEMEIGYKVMAAEEKPILQGTVLLVEHVMAGDLTNDGLVREMLNCHEKAFNTLLPIRGVKWSSDFYQCDHLAPELRNLLTEKINGNAYGAGNRKVFLLGCEITHFRDEGGDAPNAMVMSNYWGEISGKVPFYTLSVIATRDISPGEEVIITYGIAHPALTIETQSKKLKIFVQSYMSKMDLYVRTAETHFAFSRGLRFIGDAEHTVIQTPTFLSYLRKCGIDEKTLRNKEFLEAYIQTMMTNFVKSI